MGVSQGGCESVWWKWEVWLNFKGAEPESARRDFLCGFWIPGATPTKYFLAHVRHSAAERVTKTSPFGGFAKVLPLFEERSKDRRRQWRIYLSV